MASKRSAVVNSAAINSGSQSKEGVGNGVGGQQAKETAGFGAATGAPLPYPPPLSTSVDSLASATGSIGSIQPSSSTEHLHMPPASSSPNIQVRYHYSTTSLSFSSRILYSTYLYPYIKPPGATFAGHEQLTGVAAEKPRQLPGAARGHDGDRRTFTSYIHVIIVALLNLCCALLSFCRVR